MTRYFSILLLLTLFSRNILAAVIPNSDDPDHEALSDTLSNDPSFSSEDGSENGLLFDTRGDEDGNGYLDARDADAASNLDIEAFADEEQELSAEELESADSIVGRAPADCNNVIRTSIDNCKRGVQSGIAACKKRIQDDIATCKVNVRRDIDQCKKKAKDPFSKARCEARRPSRMAQCEQRRKKIPLCEKARPKVIICCEGLRTQVQGLCAAKVVPTQLVRQRLLFGQQQCMRGLII